MSLLKFKIFVPENLVSPDISRDLRKNMSWCVKHRDRKCFTIRKIFGSQEIMTIEGRQKSTALFSSAVDSVIAT